MPEWFKINGDPQDEGEGPIDYNTYRLDLKWKVFYTVLAAAFIFAAAYVFYRSLILSAILTPLSLLYPKMKRKELMLKRKRELNIQFKDMLYALSSSISAGKPIELAMRDILPDLGVLYPDPNTPIIRETEYIVRKLQMNETVERALEDFARRAHLEDVDSFVDVLKTCKRTGGNLVEVIKNTCSMITDKIEIRQEIDTAVAERRFERKVLNVLPVALLVLLSLMAEDYIRPVFTTWTGRLIMTVSVGLLAAAWFISKKVMEIEV